MNKNRYEVVFDDGSSVEEWAFSPEQARILSQAERIKAGKEYGVKEIIYLGPLQ